MMDTSNTFQPGLFGCRKVACLVTFVTVLMILLGFLSSCDRRPQSEQPSPERKDKIKVVVVTGGHGFEKEPFFAIFDSFPDIKYVNAHQQDHSEIFEDIGNWDYDVVVLYNMTQEISPERQENFVRLLRQGVGLVALHHSIGAFQQWPEYRKIIGGKFYLKDMVEDGIEHKKSKYKHDINVNVHVKDKKHSITRAMSDFTIIDETYGDQVFEKDNRILLTTDHPTSDEPLCWVRRYAKAKVCYIQLGHDSKAYANEGYQRLIAQAVRWSAGRLDGN
jgi:type 1 glutamine amidotransferase